MDVAAPAGRRVAHRVERISAAADGALDGHRLASLGPDVSDRRLTAARAAIVRTMGRAVADVADDMPALLLALLRRERRASLPCPRLGRRSSALRRRCWRSGCGRRRSTASREPEETRDDGEARAHERSLTTPGRALARLLLWRAKLEGCDRKCREVVRPTNQAERGDRVLLAPAQVRAHELPMGYQRPVALCPAVVRPTDAPERGHRARLAPRSFARRTPRREDTRATCPGASTRPRVAHGIRAPRRSVASGVALDTRWLPHPHHWKHAAVTRPSTVVVLQPA